MIQKTPLEMAIALKSDRRVRYDEKMRERGFKRYAIWLPVEFSAVVRDLAATLGEVGDMQAPHVREELEKYVCALKETANGREPQAGGPAGATDDGGHI